MDYWQLHTADSPLLTGSYLPIQRFGYTLSVRLGGLPMLFYGQVSGRGKSKRL